MENELTNFNRLNREWYEYVIEQSRVQDGKNSMSAIIHLATKAFEKRERVKVLEALNLPADYEDRKRAFIELETARYEAIQAESALRSAQAAVFLYRKTAKGYAVMHANWAAMKMKKDPTP